jgi:folate-dependent phosphoribosylglycinamide formyltransferase PurN
MYLFVIVVGFQTSVVVSLFTATILLTRPSLIPLYSPITTLTDPYALTSEHSSRSGCSVHPPPHSLPLYTRTIAVHISPIIST